MVGKQLDNIEKQDLIGDGQSSTDESVGVFWLPNKGNDKKKTDPLDLIPMVNKQGPSSLVVDDLK